MRVNPYLKTVLFGWFQLLWGALLNIVERLESAFKYAYEINEGIICSVSNSSSDLMSLTEDTDDEKVNY